MNLIIISEKTFKQQAKRLKREFPHKRVDYCRVRNILARVYGYASDHAFRQHAAGVSFNVDNKALIQDQFPILVNRLSDIADIEGHVAKYLIKTLWPDYVDKSLDQWRQHQSTFVFYGELTDFLKNSGSEMRTRYKYDGLPSVKDTIEAQGIPHSEIVLILEQGKPVNWEAKVKAGGEYHVYPANFQLNGTRLVAPRPDTGMAFALDVHLGKLARYLRMLGFDAYYMAEDRGDKYLVQLGLEQNRIVLTRDKGLLKQASLRYGYWIRHRNSLDQLREVIGHYHLDTNGHVLTRCLDCNTVLAPVVKQHIRTLLPPLIERDYNEFKQCPKCKKIYWKGSHYDRMQETLSAEIQSTNAY